MTKRTRLFLLFGAGILVVGLGTGLLASYMGLQGLVTIGGDGPAELAYVPDDARLVAFANVRDVMQSELRQRVRQWHPGDGMDRFEAETGIDIETDIDHLIASVSGSDTAVGERPPLVIARGRFDEVRIEAFVRQRGAVVQDYGGKRLLTDRDDNVSLVFLEPGLVAFGATAAAQRAIDTKAGATRNVRSNSELMQLVRAIQDGNAWAVARFDALAADGRLPPELALQLPAISWLAARGHVNGGLRGLVRAETRDEVAANDLRDVVRGFVALGRLQAGQHPGLGELVNSLELGGQGTTVSLGFVLTPEMLDAMGAFRSVRSRERAPGADRPVIERAGPPAPGLAPSL